MNAGIKSFFRAGAIISLSLLAAFVLAQAKLYSARLSARPAATAPAQTELNEEDPSFLSGFSRALDYKPNGQDIEASDDAFIIPAITGPITAAEYEALDLRSGAILESKDLDRVAPIASLTKLVTAEVSRRLVASTTRFIVTDAMLAAYGSNGHLRQGETISAGELLYPLLLVSSNDAAEALAQGYGRKDFIRAMNDWARSIGAYHTDFYDPSGLSAYTISTARDQAMILDWIYKNDPALIDILRLRSATVRLHTWTNSTHFLNLSDYAGGKDGFIPEAGETAASLFFAPGATASSSPRYLIVVLGSQNRDNDVLSLLRKAEGK